MVTAPRRADNNTAGSYPLITWQPPDEIASTFTPRRSLALRYAKGSARASAASLAQQGKTTAGIEREKTWWQQHELGQRQDL